MMKAMAKVKLDTEQTIKFQWLYKVGPESELNSWPDSSTEFSGRGFKSYSGQQLSIATSKNPSVVTTIYIYIYIYIIYIYIYIYIYVYIPMVMLI